MALDTQGDGLLSPEAGCKNSALGGGVGVSWAVAKELS